MSKPLSIFPALALTALALLIAGCGGGGDDSPTKAEFMKEAEAICKKAANAESQQQGEYVQRNYQRLQNEPPPPNNKSTGEIVRQIRVPILLKQVEELQALELPEADQEKLRKIFAGTEKGLKELDKDPQLIWASRAGNPLYPSFKAARAYGFYYCAEA